MPDLIREGYVYLAKPPLYKIERNKKEYGMMLVMKLKLKLKKN